MLEQIRTIHLFWLKLYFKKFDLKKNNVFLSLDSKSDLWHNYFDKNIFFCLYFFCNYEHQNEGAQEVQEVLRHERMDWEVALLS